MGKLFYTYGDIWNYDGDLFIIANNDYVLVDDFTVKKLSDFSKNDIINMEYSQDFIDVDNPNYLLYLSFRSVKQQGYNVKNKIVNTTYIFLKNKLYEFESRGTWYDEIGNVINEYNDIWYDPFLFVKVEDKERAIRALKLKKCKIK